MENPAIKWGIYLGIISIVLLLVFYLIDPKLIFSLSSYISMVVTIAILVLACGEVKADSGGFASFGEMFKTAFVVWAIGVLISIFFQYIFMNFVDPSLIDLQKEISIETIEKMGGLIGEEGVEAAAEEIEKSNPVSAGKMGLAAIASMLIGAIVCTIIAAIMQKKNPADF